MHWGNRITLKGENGRPEEKDYPSVSELREAERKPFAGAGNDARETFPINA